MLKQKSSINAKKDVKKRMCLQNLKRQIEQFPSKSEQDMQYIECFLSRCTQAQLARQNDTGSKFEEQTKADYLPDGQAFYCLKHGKCPHLCEESALPPYFSQDRGQYIIKADQKIKYRTLISCTDRVEIYPSRLEQQRNRAGFSQEQVVNLAWVTKTWISKSETAPCNNKYGKKSIAKSLCYYLAALYGTTPGYLMGHTDEPDRDIYITRFRRKNTRRSGKTTSEGLQIVIEELIATPIRFSSEAQIRGLQAAQSLRENPKLKNTRLLDFIDKGEAVYFDLYSKEIRHNLQLFFDGILESSPFEE